MSFKITGPGGPTTVNAPDPNGDTVPSIAAVGSARWAAVWDADEVIRGRLFGPDGTPTTTDDFVIDGDGTNICGEPRIVSIPGGGFAAVWTSNKDGDDDIYFRRYNQFGGPMDPAPIPVGGVNTKADKSADVAAFANGTFVVTWERSDGVDSDIYQSRFHLGAFSVPSLVHTDNTVQDETPRIVTLDGGWAIAWTSGNGTGRDIKLNRFDGISGSSLDPVPITVNAANAPADSLPALAEVGGGLIVVAWRSTEGGGNSIVQRIVDHMGMAMGPGEVQVNTLAATNATAPVVTAMPDGGWVTKRPSSWRRPRPTTTTSTSAAIW